MTQSLDLANPPPTCQEWWASDQKINHQLAGPCLRGATRRKRWRWQYQCKASGFHHHRHPHHHHHHHHHHEQDHSLASSTVCSPECPDYESSDYAPVSTGHLHLVILMIFIQALWSSALCEYLSPIFQADFLRWLGWSCTQTTSTSTSAGESTLSRQGAWKGALPWQKSRKGALQEFRERVQRAGEAQCSVQRS